MNNLNKGVFLTEFYGVKEIPPLLTEEGKPTKFAEAAQYWGEPIPKTEKDIKMLVAKGSALQATQNFSQPQKFSQSSVYGGKQNLSLLKPNKIKVPFIKKGQWKHDLYGEVKFDDKDFEELVENYKSNVAGFTPYLTLGHLDEEVNSTDSHRKRGDLEDIVIEGDVGYGIFGVNDEIYNSIKEGEYEYSSGEFNRQFTRREDGEKVGTTVLRVALTNSPFLPFGSTKIQALSNDAENCPENNENYVFLLSVDANKSDSEESKEAAEFVQEQTEEASNEVSEDIQNANLTDTENIMKENQVNPAAEEAKVPAEQAVVENKEIETETVVENKADDVTPTETATRQTVTKEKEVQPQAVQSNMAEAAISNLTSQLAKVEELYKTQLENANKTIETLANKIDSLTNKLDSQSEITQAFSTSMGQAQELALMNKLQDNGVMPATVQKFMTFKRAFENTSDKNVVKFSVNVGEETKDVEYNVVDAVADILVGAANQTPLVEQQLGISAGRKAGAFNFNDIIERNKAAATKLNS